MVSEPASHRGCRTKELFFMGSKGDGKHFVGLRFAWHGLESCCCSGVSEPASKGLAPKRQAFSHARALPFWPVCFFLGRGRASNAKKHPGSACFWRHFSAILMGLCRFDPCVFSLAVAVPAMRNRFVRFAIFSFSLGLPSATKSILAVPASDAIFLRFRWGSVVLGVLEGASSNAFSVWFLHGMGSNLAAVRPFWKGRRPMALYLL